MPRYFAIVLALQLAAFAANAFAQAHASLGVGIRIASAGEAPSAGSKFESALNTALRSGPRPLDWALAATASPQPSRTIGGPTSRSDGDLFRAAQAAPNDALVQWLVANHTDASAPEIAARRAAAIEALTRIEPDNGAAWMQALNQADARGDAAGVDEALTGMAQARRFDDHYIDIAHAWLDVYDRFPPRADLSTDNGYDAGFVAAIAKAAATAQPAYLTVISACKPPSASSRDFERATRCTKIGRAMLDHATTLVARSIGFAILRNLDALTDADRNAKRNIDWYRANPLQGTGYDSNPRDALAYESDWRRMNDEVDIARAALDRAGIPTEAPDGWTPPHASVVAAR
ncbi:MAG TPA: hypothetical protein VI258_11170 [Rhodanobacteraceae bacterium]